MVAPQPVDRDRALVRSEDPGTDPEQRRLARSVATGDADRAAGSDLQIDGAQHRPTLLAPTPVAPDSVEADQRVGRVLLGRVAAGLRSDSRLNFGSRHGL